MPVFDRCSDPTPPTPADLLIYKDAETGRLKNCTQLQLSESVGYVPEPDPEVAEFELAGDELIEIVKDGVKYYTTMPVLIAEPQTYTPSIIANPLTTVVRDADG